MTDVPPPSMRLREFTPEAIVLEARFRADSRCTNLMNTASAARVAIVQALTAVGINLPDNNQRVVTMAAPPAQGPVAGPPGGSRMAV